MNSVGFGIQSFYFHFFFFLVLFVEFFRRVYYGEIQRKQFVLTCFLLFFFLAGMRGINVGADLKRYFPEFFVMQYLEDIRNVIRYSYHEVGYMLYIKLLNMISSDERCYLIGTSFISMIGPFYMFYKFSKQPNVSILLFYAMGYYTMTFCDVRQAMALSFTFFSLLFLVKRKKKYFMFFVFLATLFHQSAIVMMIAYPLTSYPLNRKRFMTYVSLCITISLFAVTILRFVVTNYLFKYDPELINEEGAGGGFNLFLFQLLIFILMSIFYFSNRYRISKEQSYLLSIFVIFQLLTTTIQLTAPIYSSMVRMTYYFFIPVVTIAVPEIYGLIRQKKVKKMYYLLIFLFAIIYMIRVYSYNPINGSNKQGVIPYVFLETTIY